MEICLPHISDLAAWHALVIMTDFVCHLLRVSQNLLSNNIIQRETPDVGPDDVFKMHAKLNDHEAHAGVSNTSPSQSLQLYLAHSGSQVELGTALQFRFKSLYRAHSVFHLPSWGFMRAF